MIHEEESSNYIFDVPIVVRNANLHSVNLQTWS